MRKKKKSTINLIKNLGSFHGANESAKQKSFSFLMSRVYPLFFPPHWQHLGKVSLGSGCTWTMVFSMCLPAPGLSRILSIYVLELPPWRTLHVFRRNRSQGTGGEDKAPRTHSESWLEWSWKRRMRTVPWVIRKSSRKTKEAGNQK